MIWYLIQSVRQVVSESDVQQSVGGELSIAVHNIPQFDIGGMGSINMSETERNFYESISCKVCNMYCGKYPQSHLILSKQMYGDFILDSSPTTYNDSIQAYQVRIF